MPPVPKPRFKIPCDACGIELSLLYSRIISSSQHYCGNKCRISHHNPVKERWESKSKRRTQSKEIKDWFDKYKQGLV